MATRRERRPHGQQAGTAIAVTAIAVLAGAIVSGLAWASGAGACGAGAGSGGPIDPVCVGLARTLAERVGLAVAVATAVIVLTAIGLAHTRTDPWWSGRRSDPDK